MQFHAEIMTHFPVALFYSCFSQRFRHVLAIADRIQQKRRPGNKVRDIQRLSMIHPIFRFKSSPRVKAKEAQKRLNFIMMKCSEKSQKLYGFNLYSPTFIRERSAIWSVN